MYNLATSVLLEINDKDCIISKLTKQMSSLTKDDISVDRKATQVTSLSI